MMSRALSLGARGLDTATPNPSVGCVIAKGGRVIGEGWHARAGEPHAEAAALAACREDPTGATAYVTLEPCSHRGRTPPCADALVRAGLARVVAALEDPNPLVAGAGFRRLREAGLQVEAGLLAGEAALLHRAFLSRMSRGRPWMILKAGASLDGRTALANGESRWITSEEARRDVHRLRRRACAVLTGYGTVRADDPDLTVRHVPCERQPRRVVIDNRLELPEGARVLQGVPPLVFTVSGDGAARERLESRGAEVLAVGAEGSKTDLVAVARMLAARGFNEVLVETGPKLAGSLLRAGIVDEIVLYLAPSLLGDLAQGLFALGELASLGERRNLAVTDVRAVGRDLRVTARLES